MLNRYPYTNGHLMVAPVAHEARLFDSADRSLRALIRLTAEAQRILSDVYHPDGFNIGMNFGQVAGAGVADHYHLHIVPRWSGDSNFMTVTAQTRLVPEELDVTFDKLAPHFREHPQDRTPHEHALGRRHGPGLSRPRRRPLLPRPPRAAALAFFAIVVAAVRRSACAIDGGLYTLAESRGALLSILASLGSMGSGRALLRRPRASGRTATSRPSRTSTARTFTLTAGLMNLLLVLDCYDIAEGRKQ